MKRGEITLGKWHFKLGFTNFYACKYAFIFHFGIFKITSYPTEGEMISKENYKGFWLRKELKQFEIGFYLSK